MSHPSSTTPQKVEDDFDSELVGLAMPELNMSKAPTALASQFPEAAAAAASENYPDPAQSKTKEKQRVEKELVGKEAEETKVGSKRAALREKAARFKRTESGAPSKGGGPLAGFGLETLQESLSELANAASAESRGEEMSTERAAALMSKTKNMLNALMGSMSGDQKTKFKKSMPGAGDMISQLMRATPEEVTGRRKRTNRSAATAASTAGDDPVPELIPLKGDSKTAAPITSSSSSTAPSSTPPTAGNLPPSKSKKRREKLKQKIPPRATPSSITYSHPSVPD